MAWPLLFCAISNADILRKPVTAQFKWAAHNSDVLVPALVSIQSHFILSKLSRQNVKDSSFIRLGLVPDQQLGTVLQP